MLSSTLHQRLHYSRAESPSHETQEVPAKLTFSSEQNLTHTERQKNLSPPHPWPLFSDLPAVLFFFFGLILSLGWCECWKDGLSILAIIPCSLEWVFLIFCVLSLVYGFRFFGHCFDWIQGNCWLFPCQHMNSKIVWLLVLWFSLSWSLPWGFCENVEIHVLKPGSLSFIKNVFVFVALACCGVNIYSLLFLALWMRIFSRLLF